MKFNEGQIFKNVVDSPLENCAENCTCSVIFRRGIRWPNCARICTQSWVDATAEPQKQKFKLLSLSTYSTIPVHSRHSSCIA